MKVQALIVSVLHTHPSVAYTHLLERVGISSTTGNVIAESIYKDKRKESHARYIVPALQYFTTATREVLSSESNTQNENAIQTESLPSLLVGL